MRTMMVPAAVAVFALGAQLGSAHADDIRGRPLQNGNKCFQYSVGQARDARFGYWDACPQNASAHIPARVPVGTTASEAATVPPATRAPAVARIARIPVAARMAVAAKVSNTQTAPHRHVGATVASSVGRNAPSETTVALGRLKMKIGEAEFEADVPESKIQPMYDQFIATIGRQSQITANAPRAGDGRTGGAISSLTKDGIPDH
jgi:hypothetical protein